MSEYAEKKKRHMWHPPFYVSEAQFNRLSFFAAYSFSLASLAERAENRFIYMVCTSLIPSRPSGRKPSMIICGSLLQPKKTQAVWTWEYLTVTIWVCRVSLQFSWNLFNPVWWWLKAWCQLLGFFSVWLKQQNKVFSEAGTEFPGWSREATVPQRTDKKTSSSWENSSSNMMAARNRMQLECWLSQCMYFLEAGEQSIKRKGGVEGGLLILCVAWIQSLGCITDGFPISLWTWWGASQQSSQLSRIVKSIFLPFMWSSSEAADIDYLCLWIFFCWQRGLDQMYFRWGVCID